MQLFSHVRRDFVTEDRLGSPPKSDTAEPGVADPTLRLRVRGRGSTLEGCDSEVEKWQALRELVTEWSQKSEDGRL